MALGVLKNWYTKTELGSNANGLGASLIGIEDDGGYFTGTEVETALQELGAGLASENLWDRTGTVLTTHTAGDKIKLDSGASLYWDNGSGTADIQLYRSAANVLRTPDSLYVDTRINVGSAGEAYVRGIVDMHGTGFPIARYCNKINGNDSGAFTGFSGINSTNYLTKETTGVAGNGFGHGLVFGVKDSTMSGDSNFITRIYARSDDNDGTGDTGWGRLQFWVGSNGTKRSLDLCSSGLGRFEESVQVQGYVAPLEGVGAELRYVSGRASLLGYNRDTTAYIPTELKGSIIYLNASGTDELTVSTTGTTIGSGNAGVDYTLTFDGENSDGSMTWMEDENYLRFDDETFMSGQAKAYFQSANNYIYGYSISQLHLASTGEIHLVAGGANTLEVIHDTGTTVHLGDNAGSHKFTVEDSGNISKAEIDSDGNVQFDGTLTTGASAGITTTFTNGDGATVTVTNGLITDIT